MKAVRVNDVSSRVGDVELYCLNTEDFAALNGVRPQTIRAAVCQSGGYFGIKPLKRANRFLSWPAVVAQ